MRLRVQPPQGAEHRRHRPQDQEDRPPVQPPPSQMVASFPVGRPGAGGPDVGRPGDRPRAQDQPRSPGRVPAGIDRRGRLSAWMTLRPLVARVFRRQASSPTGARTTSFPGGVVLNVRDDTENGVTFNGEHGRIFVVAPGRAPLTAEEIRRKSFAGKAVFWAAIHVVVHTIVWAGTYDPLGRNIRPSGQEHTTLWAGTYDPLGRNIRPSGQEHTTLWAGISP
jgi:hypothetical protein